MFKRRRSDRDEDIGSQTGASLAILPFGSDHGSEHECSQQTDQGVQKVVELKGLNEAHCLSRSGDQKLPAISLLPPTRLAYVDEGRNYSANSE